MAAEEAAGSGRDRHHRRARLRPRAAADLPDRHPWLVRRPAARTGPGTAGLLQRRRLRRRRRDRRAGHVLPRAAACPQPRRSRTVLVRLDLAASAIAALREIGGISTETIVEDMHTTLGLIRAGWKTVYHHQTLALGLAPATPEQYLLQRRRWGMGSMQVLAHERLWAAKRGCRGATSTSTSTAPCGGSRASRRCSRSPCP